MFFSSVSLVTLSWLFLLRMQKQNLFLTWIIPTRFVVRTECILGLPTIVFASCLALHRALYQNHSTFETWIFYLRRILVRKFFGKHWQNFWLIELNSHPEQFICPSMFFITALFPTDGPFGWRDPEKWYS